MRYGIYCGSFAPVHNGHTSIMRAALEQGAADKIIVVPTGDYKGKNVSLPLATRLECLRLFESEQIIIDDDPKDTSAAKTVTLMQDLQKKFPADKLLLVLGADNLLNLDKWYHAEELIEKYPFIIMNRNDIDTKAELKRLGKEDYTILNCPQINISSSYIMAHLNEPELVSDLTSEKVLQIVRTAIR